MNFMDELKKQENELFNYSLTENGALGYSTTLNPFTDFFFKLSSFRKNPQEAVSIFDKCLDVDKELAVRLLFYLRDIRGGCGERATFRVIMTHLSHNVAYKDIVINTLPFFAEYGRWDDVLDLYFTTKNKDLKRYIVNRLCEQFFQDVQNSEKGKPISLLAKWMPSINVKSQRRFALELMEAMQLCSEKSYRKLLANLRSYLKIVEQKMSANEWQDIDYSAVPSRANVKYNSAFLRHDTARRARFLQSVSKGEQKINSSTNTPTDIVTAYMGGASWSGYLKQEDAGLEALWKSLPSPAELGNTLVVADVSGSMSGKPMNVSYAMACYFAERAKGAYKDKAIIFSCCPCYVDLIGSTLHEKLVKLDKYVDCTNTDIEATFDLILQTAIASHAKQEELPKQILVISDMEFDSATTRRVDGRLFNEIIYKYEMAGYKMPKIVFWNVASRTGTIPLTTNEFGVSLLSGYSPYIAEMVVSNKLEPFEQLKEQLMKPRYDVVVEALKLK